MLWPSNCVFSQTSKYLNLCLRIAREKELLKYPEECFSTKRLIHNLRISQKYPVSSSLERNLDKITMQHTWGGWKLKWLNTKSTLEEWIWLFQVPLLLGMACQVMSSIFHFCLNQKPKLNRDAIVNRTRAKWNKSYLKAFLSVSVQATIILGFLLSRPFRSSSCTASPFSISMYMRQISMPSSLALALGWLKTLLTTPDTTSPVVL